MIINTTEVSKTVETIKNHVGDNAALIFIAEHCTININTLIKALNEANITFMGGVFPKLIHNNTVIEDGIVLSTIRNLEQIFLLKNISKKDYTVPTINFENSKDYSLLTFVDGLTSNISFFLEKLYENYGMKTNYIGGGAGSLTLEQKPCVFTKDGFFEDAAIIAVTKQTTNIGVKHGWNKVEGPFVVTKAEGNVIKEINWENPFSVYKKVIEKHANVTFNETNFFDLAKGYPFGILKEDAEYIVRDLIRVDDEGGLVCGVDVEENTLLDVLNGDNNTLINAAKEAASDSLKNAKKPNKSIIIDCISRILFLKDDFDKELTGITSTLTNSYPNISINGALTMGEISSYGEGFLELYNKTTVIGLFES